MRTMVGRSLSCSRWASGNYTEEDIKECARAFTGWRVVNPDYMSIKMRNNTARPYGYISWQFEYDDEDHDHSEKTLLGQTGDWNGEDAVDIICRNEATPRFIARHLYHFFVADEPGVSRSGRTSSLGIRKRSRPWWTRISSRITASRRC